MMIIYVDSWTTRLVLTPGPGWFSFHTCQVLYRYFFQDFNTSLVLGIRSKAEFFWGYMVGINLVLVLAKGCYIHGITSSPIYQTGTGIKRLALPRVIPYRYILQPQYPCCTLIDRYIYQCWSGINLFWYQLVLVSSWYQTFGHTRLVWYLIPVFIPALIPVSGTSTFFFWLSQSWHSLVRASPTMFSIWPTLHWKNLRWGS
jgi:hypothetical protein